MKNKKILIPLVAVVVLGILLAVVLLTGTDKPQNNATSDAGETQQYEKEYLFDFVSGDISYIKVNSGEENYGFTKRDDVWVLSDNPDVSISTGSVNMLAGSIVNIAYSEAISDGSITKSDCGITDSSNYVTFTCDGNSVTVFAGINTTDGLWTYVMTSMSDTVYLAYKETVQELFNPLSTYRNSASMNVDFDAIKTITVKNGSTLVFEKGATNADAAIYNEWRLTSPISVSARDDQIKALILDPLKQIKITDFASDSGDFANYGLASKDKYVALTDLTGKTQTLYFSEQKDGRYYICIDDKKSIYSISYDDAPYVNLETKEIFDRNIHLVKMVDISTVTLKGDGYDYKIEFGDKGGKVNGTEVTSDVMNQQVFASVCGIFADDILLEAPVEPKVTLTFYYKNGKNDVITFTDHSERYYSVAKNGTTKYMILKAKISDLAKTLDECK